MSFAANGESPIRKCPMLRYVPSAEGSECADRAAQLAYSKDPLPPPTPPGENQTGDWKPLGVWALTQEEKGDAFMFLQLSVNKAGAISGAYANVLSGEKEPVSHIGEQSTSAEKHSR
jgi:hypothetical protein